MGSVNQNIRGHIKHFKFLYGVLCGIGVVGSCLNVINEGIKKEDIRLELEDRRIFHLQAAREANERNSGYYLPQGVTEEDIKQASREYDPEDWPAAQEVLGKYRHSPAETMVNEPAE